MANSSLWSESSSRVRKGAWSEEEDNLLRKCIQKYGEGKWHLIPFRAGLNRCRKSCRLRWLNYLHPDIKRGHFSSDEADLILRLHKLLGNRWSLIAGRIPGRTANDVKNYWNTHLQKKAFAMASSRQDNYNNWKGKAPEIWENTVVLRPRPRRFSKTSYRTSLPGEATAVAYDAQLLQQHTMPQPEAASHFLMENVQQNNSITTSPPHDKVLWWEDVLSDKELNNEEQIGWTEFPTDMDLMGLLS